MYNQNNLNKYISNQNRRCNLYNSNLRLYNNKNSSKIVLKNNQYNMGRIGSYDKYYINNNNENFYNYDQAINEHKSPKFIIAANNIINSNIFNIEQKNKKTKKNLPNNQSLIHENNEKINQFRSRGWQDYEVEELYKCIFYYYCFCQEKLVITKIKNIPIHAYLLDKDWLEEFKENLKFREIKKELDSYPYQITKNDFSIYKSVVRKFQIDKNVLKNPPKPARKINLIDNIQIYDNFDFVDEDTMEIIFKNYNVKKSDFESLKVRLIDNNFFIFIYDNNKFYQIVIKNENMNDEKFLFEVNDPRNNIYKIIHELTFQDNKNVFIKYGFMGISENEKIYFNKKLGVTIYNINAILDSKNNVIIVRKKKRKKKKKKIKENIDLNNGNNNINSILKKVKSEEDIKIKSKNNKYPNDNGVNNSNVMFNNDLNNNNDQFNNNFKYNNINNDNIYNNNNSLILNQSQNKNVNSCYEQSQINSGRNKTNLNVNLNNKQNKNKKRNKNALISITKPCLVGLTNVGATCYMNATLQCLSNVKELTLSLLNPERNKIMEKDKYSYKLTIAYSEVLKNLWNNNSVKSYSPYSFKNTISMMNPLFAGINANDSKDLILFLLETMHNELNPIKIEKPNNIPPNGQYYYEIAFKFFAEYFANNYRSIISNLFYGMFNSMMQCANCGRTTHNVQCYNILIFPLEEVKIFKRRYFNKVDILECFEYYQHVEILTGMNQIYCNICKNLENCYNSSKIIIAPNILIVNLNRGKGNQFNIKLTFGEYLDIKQFIYYNQSPNYYELIGVVTHLGPSGMSGHFIAYCKSFVDFKWYKFNDAMVDECSFSDVTQVGTPYILFYSKIDR